MHLSDRSILFLDDDFDLLSAYEYALNQEGYLIKCANNVEEAIQYLRKNLIPRLLLVDFRMARTSGAEVLKKLHEAVPNLISLTKIYVFSGLDKLNPLLDSARPFVHGVVEKPNDLNELIETLNCLFESRPHRHILNHSSE